MRVPPLGKKLTPVISPRERLRSCLSTYYVRESVANWAYLKIGASAAFSHVSCTREEIDSLLQCAMCVSRAQAFAGSQGCDSQRVSAGLRRKNRRITFGDRDGGSPSVFEELSGYSPRARDLTFFFFPARSQFSGWSRASLLSLLRWLTASGAERCIASFCAAGHLIHFPRTGIARDDSCEFGQVPA